MGIIGGEDGPRRPGGWGRAGRRGKLGAREGELRNMWKLMGEEALVGRCGSLARSRRHSLGRGLRQRPAWRGYRDLSVSVFELMT